ncbi:VOC family protein [Lentzea tibetensis]|uniref:VOC family protein n=1 Tax=Lentzea tibetensis TaxID=2591470 RepID=A0A563EHV6_9PSEU|nr:VOC family protein [Lentzea tibetensis]TWP46242.1 VOC family protein [Lentzea tibetensis]
MGFQVTMDAADPAKQAEFWAQALGYVLQPPPPGFDSWEAFLDKMNVPQEARNSRSAIVDPAGVGSRVFFQQVPEGKTAKNRVHIDVNASNGTHDRALVAAHVAKLEGLGAQRVEEFDDPLGYWITMLDPEGNEFCVQ